MWIERPWPENLNTCTWHIETLDCCFNLISSHQQCILRSSLLEIEPMTECRAETLPLSLSPHCIQVMPYIIPLLKKENVHLYPCPWGYNNYVDAYFQSSWEDVVLQVTCVLCKVYWCNLQDTFRLIGCAIAMTS